MASRPNVNVFHQVRAKETQKRSLVRTNHSIMRSIICQEDVHFVKIKEVLSNTFISYESNRLYTDNYRSCLAGYGHNGKPCPLYKLPKCPTSQKIEDALVCEYHPEDVSEETRPHLITLTKDNWIVRHHLDNGRVLQRIYLHPTLKYTYLNWYVDGTSIVVKTTKSKTTRMMREAQVPCNILMTMAVFTIYPLELMACMEVDKRIFGDDTTGAQLGGCNILFTTHQRGIVRFYSFERILEENSGDKLRLGDDFPTGGEDSCKIGQAPHGIPITLRLTEKPAVLLEVRCHDNDIQFGGFPWHYLTCPKSRVDPTHIKVYNVATQEEAINGALERNMLDVGSPGAAFHIDGSERIMNTKLRSISVLKIHQRDDGKCEVIKDHVIKQNFSKMDSWLEEDARDFKPNRIEYTHTGRPIKFPCEYYDGDGMFNVLSSQMISTFSCENDLDLLVLSMPTSDEDDGVLHGYVSLHDSATGRLLKTVALPGVWDDTVVHSVSLDLDTLIHVSQTPSGKWICEVYRALRKSVSKEMTFKSKRGTTTKRRPKGRRR